MIVVTEIRLDGDTGLYKGDTFKALKKYLNNLLILFLFNMLI